MVTMGIAPIQVLHNNNNNNNINNNITFMTDSSVAVTKQTIVGEAPWSSCRGDVAQWIVRRNSNPKTMDTAGFTRGKRLDFPWENYPFGQQRFKKKKKKIVDRTSHYLRKANPEHYNESPERVRAT